MRVRGNDTVRKLTSRAECDSISVQTITLKRSQAGRTPESIFATARRCLLPGCRRKLSIPSTNATWRAGLSGTSASDSVSCPAGLSSASGPGPNCTINSCPNTAGSITTTPWSRNLSGEPNTGTWTTGWTCISFRPKRLHSKLWNGTTVGLTLSERKMSTRMRFKRCRRCRSSTGTRNSKWPRMERKIRCTSSRNGRFSGERVATTTIWETKPSGNSPKHTKKWLKNITDPSFKSSIQSFLSNL